jgi:predicted nucleic acid-binding protein
VSSGSPLFIDTNIILRFLLDDQPDHTDKIEALLQEASVGKVNLWSHDAAFIEAAFVLERRKGIAREQIADWFDSLIAGSLLTLTGEGILEEVLKLYVRYTRLSIVDCYFAVLAKRSTSGTIVSFDQGFDRVPDLTRIEPPVSGKI